MDLCVCVFKAHLAIEYFFVVTNDYYIQILIHLCSLSHPRFVMNVFHLSQIEVQICNENQYLSKLIFLRLKI